MTCGSEWMWKLAYAIWNARRYLESLGYKSEFAFLHIWWVDKSILSTHKAFGSLYNWKSKFAIETQQRHCFMWCCDVIGLPLFTPKFKSFQTAGYRTSLTALRYAWLGHGDMQIAFCGKLKNVFVMKITVWNYASCAHTALIRFSLIAFELHASGLYLVWVIFAFTAVSCREHNQNTKPTEWKWTQKLYNLSPGATRPL